MNYDTLEALEPRRLLSGVLKDGIVTIVGTNNGETINFFFGRQDPDRLIVFNGGEEFSFPSSQIRRIRVQGLGGNDRIAPLNVSGEVDIPLSASGGDGDDTITGTIKNDSLIGAGGNDTLIGREGFDLADYRYVTVNFARLDGLPYGLIASLDGVRNDETSDGTDNISDDIEQVIGTPFRDSIVGNGVANTISGGKGPDRLYGTGGDDLLEANSGSDQLFGGSGNDLLLGGDGNSSLEGDDGNDQLIGGDGDETLSGGTGNDLYNGGAGIDEADFTEDVAFRMSFDKKKNDGPEGENDDFREIDVVNTAGDGDRIDARGLSHRLEYHASGGAVSVQGTEFDDLLAGEDGEISGNGGNDTLRGGLGGSLLKSAIFGGEGDDLIETADGEDNIDGGGGKDNISSGDGNDTVQGGAGNDIIRAGLGNDSVRGGKGTDRIRGEEGDDTLIGDGVTNDFLTGEEGRDAFLLTEVDAGFVTDFNPNEDRQIAE